MQRLIKPPLPSVTLARSRELRGTSTDAKRAPWKRLRDSQRGGFKFRRQHPIAPYIADFYCDVAELVVELDGSQHNEESDRIRAHYLKSQGLSVLRFWDNDILMNIEAVLESILSAAENRTLTPTRC